MLEKTPYSPPSSDDRGRDWLAALMLRRHSRLMPRFAVALSTLRDAPRVWRRRLRRAAVSLAGAALILAMAGSPLLVPRAYAASINVADGEIAVNDNGVCSIIEAIINANDEAATHDDCTAGSGADAVNLPAGGLFEFTAFYVDYSGYTGTPVVTSEITINGNGSVFDTSGAPDLRFLAVGSTGDLTVDDLTMQNAAVSGGSNGGGAIFSDGGALTVTNSTFSGNESSSGGAILVDGGTLDITDSTFNGNDGFRGGAIASYDAATIITTTTISGNFANRNGGGIVARGGSLTLTDSIVSGNGDDPLGGTDYVDYGGGIFASRIDLSITRSTIDGNKANYVGGGLAIQASDSVTISQSAITNNTSTGEGGGIIWGGFGDSGAYPATGSITNTTISGNSAGESGGGIQLDNGELTLDNVTISDNEASYEGGGIFVNDGTVNFNRTIVSGNTAGTADEISIYVGTYGSGSAIVNNFNLFGHSGINDAAAFTNFITAGSDITATSDGTEPTALANILAPLADNGGPTTPATQTHALVAGSPALDHAPDAACAAATPVDGVDQRDEPRNVDGDGTLATGNECDIGAYEATYTPPLSICPAPDNELTTILGKGMGNTKKAVLRTKLLVPNAGDLVALYGQLAGKEVGKLPKRVRFQYPNGSFTQVDTLTGTSARPGGIYWFGANLTPASSVIGRFFPAPGPVAKFPRAFVLYATHETALSYFDTYVTFADGTTNMVGPVAPFEQEQTLTIPIDSPLAMTDITVQVALVDNDKDSRGIGVTAAAGGQDVTVVSYVPTHGNLLNILTLVIEDVPTETSEVTLTLRSSVEDDSAAIIGAAVNYVCTPTS